MKNSINLPFILCVFGYALGTGVTNKRNSYYLGLTLCFCVYPLFHKGKKPLFFVSSLVTSCEKASYILFANFEMADHHNLYPNSLNTGSSFYVNSTLMNLLHIYTPRKLCLWEGILFSRCPSVRTSECVSVTFCFLNNFKNH